MKSCVKILSDIMSRVFEITHHPKTTAVFHSEFKKAAFFPNPSNSISLFLSVFLCRAGVFLQTRLLTAEQAVARGQGEEKSSTHPANVESSSDTN